MAGGGMTLQEYEKISSLLEQECKNIQEAKRPAYTIGNADVLHNFKSVAARVGVTPGQVLAVYFLKHADAVTAALCNPALPQAEPILGRFADLVNYAYLGFALVSEGPGPAPQLPSPQG